MFIPKKQLLAVIAAAAVCITAAVALKIGAVETFSETKITVALDPGHGFPDGGAVGAAGTLEKDVNLAVVQKLAEILESRGNRVVLTRTGDSGLHDGTGTIRQKKIADMKKRVEIINSSGAELLISVHMNALNDSSVTGLHIFYNRAHEEIKPLAEKILSSVSDATGAEAHGAKPAADSLYLMKNTKIPAVLIECGFLSNPDEEKKLNNDEYQSRIAWAIANALS
ncbi:MAG TPA: N-acetylmuramoyl-L-alanine amidase [Candidatus Ornithomonoglobus intestinigallinarum]|uniref:N-acetylmuramoyl-L-alanine amidase n=1 Tax=Candidatus Ornithomonoglobus intestinigallinarum TaxID=2840894 RepID=A0A9D1H279_9FIRM|nr:N-acetylmuramoyl-L-alanine amidase [Candidatus Ornithomonoglobus intestinigallinarum]